MHSENFYDHKMRLLTPKPIFTGDVSKRNEVLYHSINGSDIKTDSPLTHNLNGKVPNTPAIRDIITTIEKEMLGKELRSRCHSINEDNKKTNLASGC